MSFDIYRCEVLLIITVQMFAFTFFDYPVCVGSHLTIRVEVGTTFSTRPKFSWDHSALMNAVVSLHGKAVGDYARHYFEDEKITMGIKNLEQMSLRFREIEASLTKCEILRCPRAKGVWFVRFFASFLSNHLIVMDFHRGLFWMAKRTICKAYRK